jgi:hypothetical protein
MRFQLWATVRQIVRWGVATSLNALRASASRACPAISEGCRANWLGLTQIRHTSSVATLQSPTHLLDSLSLFGFFHSFCGLSEPMTMIGNVYQL